MPNDTLKQFGMAALVFATSQVLVASVLYFTGEYYFNASNWLRWDSGHYIHIAESGYEFFSCAGKFGYPADATEYCGNTGWFPGYPLLLRALSLFFNDITLVAGTASKLFYFLSIFMLYKVSGLKDLDLKGYVFGCLGAFWFGFIYYNAVFPTSATVFFIVSGSYFLLRRKIWLAGSACLLASFFYSTGSLLSIVFAIHILLQPGPLKRKAFDLLIPVTMGSVGLALAFYVIYLDTGVWDAFIKVQEKYGHGWHDPIQNIIEKMKNIQIGEVKSFQFYQSIGVLCSFLIFSWFFIRRKLYQNSMYLLTWLFVLVFLAFPWTIGGDLSIYRSEALLFPIVLSFRELDIKWLILILIILLLIGIPMAYLFFTSVLV